MKRAVLSGLVMVVLAGCGGFRLNPVSPVNIPGSVRASMPIAAVRVEISPGMDDGQARVLEKYQVAPEMERVLTMSLGANKAPNGAVVNVVLTSIRHSSFGPSRMHSSTTVVGPDGAVLKSFEAESFSMRSKALERVAQDHVQKLADGV